MSSIPKHKRSDVVSYNGAKYVRINPEEVDVSKMTLVKKVSDVVAGQVAKGVVKVVTQHGDDIETINHAMKGDWVVYNIGASDFPRMADKLLYCDRKAITRTNFGYLYQMVDSQVIHLTPDEIIRLTQEIIKDNLDNKEFSDTSFLANLRRYRYIGKAVYGVHVPFNFVIRAPWGQDQFVKRGGYLIYDQNVVTQQEEQLQRHMYGIEGARNRTPGEFEKTYTLISDPAKADPAMKQGNAPDGRVIADTFKIALQCDRSPVAGIQFNSIDVAKSYDRAKIPVPDNLKKYVDDKPENPLVPEKKKDKPKKEKLLDRLFGGGKDKGNDKGFFK